MKRMYKSIRQALHSQKTVNGNATHLLAPIIIVDTGNHTIREITEDGTVSTLCGSPGIGKLGSTDGKGSAAIFFSPSDVAVSPNGTLYVADRYNHTIRKITEDGTVSTLCGSPAIPKYGTADGKYPVLWEPYYVAVSSNGTLYVTDILTHTIVQITEDGTMSTFCGSPGKKGSIDGKGSAARFNAPSGIAVSPNGTLYVVDSGNSSIRKITEDGTVSTLCGSCEMKGSTDGKGSAARFNAPTAIAISPNGTLYVCDSFNSTIRKITEDGTVSTLCGSPKKGGSTDGKGPAARLSHPFGIAVVPNGNILVCDTYNHTIRQITEDGTVSTLYGSPGKEGSTDGKGSAARFFHPTGIALKLNMIQWTPKTHSLFPLIARKRVITVLMMAAKRPDGTPWHPESLFHSLPKDILLFILQWSITCY